MSTENPRQIVIGAHGPVELRDVRLISPADMAYYYHTAAVPGLGLSYRGHRDDLVAANCIAAERLRERFDRFHDGGHGGLWHIASTAGPGKRGWVKVSYYLLSRALARKLPAVATLCGVELSALGEPPEHKRFGAAAQLAAECDEYDLWLRGGRERNLCVQSEAPRPALRLVVDNTREPRP